MAETYDWRMLRSIQAHGFRGNTEKAQELYELAAVAGIENARERLEALKSNSPPDAVSFGEERRSMRVHDSEPARAGSQGNFEWFAKSRQRLRAATDNNGGPSQGVFNGKGAK
jgi:hypothetical protein